MSDSIVEAGSGTIRVSPLGATFEGDVPEDAVERLMERAGSASRSCLFIIGDAINYATSRWGEKYDRWIELTGLEYQTLANGAWVAKKIEFSVRTENLTFEHHKLVARLAPEQRETWLGLADKDGWSTRRLRKSLLLGRPATDEDMAPKPDDRGIDNVHPHVNRICGFWGRLKRSGWLKTVTLAKIKTLRRDLAPVLAVDNELREIERRLEEGQ